MSQISEPNQSNRNFLKSPRAPRSYFWTFLIRTQNNAITIAPLAARRNAVGKKCNDMLPLMGWLRGVQHTRFFFVELLCGRTGRIVLARRRCSWNVWQCESVERLNTRITRRLSCRSEVNSEPTRRNTLCQSQAATSKFCPTDHRSSRKSN